MNKLISVNEVARRLGMNPSHIRELLRGGYIPGLKINGTVWRIAEGDLELIAEQKGKRKNKRSV